MKTEKMKLRLTLTEPQLGTVPKDPEVYKTYIASKAPDPENGAEETATVATMEKLEEKGWTGFHQDDNGVFIYDYMIRGFLKNAGNQLKEQLKIKNLRSKIDNLVFSFPRRIYFQREGKNIHKPDGVIERPLRAMTMQGPRVTLARSDYMNAGTILKCEVTIIENKEITKDTILELLDYGTLCGLGQFKNGSYGRFAFKVE